MSTLEAEQKAYSAVEGFSLWLDGFDAILAASTPVAEIETMLLSRLEAPVRLLRWAIVKAEGSRILCEGAYLKTEARSS